MTANVSPQVYENGVRQVAGGVILVPATTIPRPADYHVLLITSRSDPSKWILPQGGYEEDDSSPRYAAARETWEESGVRFTDEAHFSHLGKVYVNKTVAPQQVWWYSYVATRTAPSTGGSSFEEHDSGDEPVVFECNDKDWLEGSLRKRRWFPLIEARRIVTRKHMAAALEMAIDHCDLFVETNPKALDDTTIPVYKSTPPR